MSVKDGDVLEGYRMHDRFKNLHPAGAKERYRELRRDGEWVLQEYVEREVIDDWRTATLDDLQRIVDEMKPYDTVPKLELDHDYEGKGYGDGCEYALKVSAWRDVPADEVAKLVKRGNDRARAQELTRQNELRAQIERSERELEKLRRRRDGS